MMIKDFNDELYEDDKEISISSKKYTVLVIYDIVDNKKRLKLSKYLSKFGIRVQKSSFEARLASKVYEKMMRGLRLLLDEDDNVRVYKLYGKEEITVIGKQDYSEDDDIIVI